LDSAANSSSTAAKPPTSPRPASGGTPIAHEVQVIATGTRQTENSDKRELFKEATSTALVFPNGGVIRLSAAVDPGQLIFLTNEQTKREVVAQVTRKRVNPSSGFYIELEFTEPAPGFWGIEFPENPVAAPATPQQPSAVEYELLHSDEPAPGDLSPSVPAPTTAEVQALVDEVEALRAQLRSMQTQTAPAKPELLSLDAPVSATAPPLPAMLAAILNQSIAPQSNAPASEHAVPSALASASSRPVDAQPSEEKQLAHEPEEVLLPKPALDFQKAKTPKQAPPPNQPIAASNDRSGLLRLALLAVVSLFAVTVAAWNMHWLPWLTGPTAPFGTASSPTANPSTQTRQATTQKPDAHPDTSTHAQTTDNSPSQPNAAGADAAQSANASTEAPSSDAQEQPAERVDATSKHATKKDSAPVVSVAKRSLVPPSPATESTPADDTTAIVPPRLLKSVKPIAPSDALQSFVTGNVTLDVLVDKSGHVESMIVLSGPPSFHKAAMDAIKQYRYEPARQHGKPVSAHVTVTVPFLFEP